MMKIIFLITLLCYDLVYAQEHKKIHDQLLVVDIHNDVIYETIFPGKDIGLRLKTGHTDLHRLKADGVDVQVFAVWSDDKKYGKGKAFKHANAQIDALEKMLKKYPDQIALAKNSHQIDSINRTDKIVALIGIEGGNMIENSIEHLESLYNRGARYLTLTWNYNLSWASAAAIESKGISTKRGLSEHGKTIINKMNELGMLVDLSHVGEQTFYDVLATTKKPVLVSHSNAYALTPHYRNLKDKQLEALKKNGGVIGVNFYSAFLDSGYNARVKKLYKQHFGDQGNYKLSVTRQYESLPSKLKSQANVSMAKLIDHIDYLVKYVGIDHVAVGSDFDGIESPPQGLEDVSQFPNLTKALLERGYQQQDIAKIMGLNFLRLLKENEN